MRLAFLFGAFALACCTPNPAQQACDVSVTQDIAFTGHGADVVTARTLGPSCGRAFALYTVASSEGHPIWAWTAPVPRAFGDLFINSGPEEMRAFLERWAQPKLERTAAAPPWPLPDFMHTTLDRATYEDIRARDLPMLCHLSGTALETCVFWEPVAGGAGHFLDRDVREISGVEP